jgi:hypothetical protein
MSKRHKVDVHGTLGARGVTTWLVSGEGIVVGGEPMVRLSHGAIVPDRGFFDTVADAKQQAAGEIEVLAHKLLQQADAMRAEAAMAEVAAAVAE